MRFIAGFFLFILLVFSKSADAKGWHYQNSGIINLLVSVFFPYFNADNIVSVGDSGLLQKTSKKNPGCSYSIIHSSDKTYGYDIYLGKRLLIHQPVIPGLTGTKGFKSRKDAIKVARFVIKKIQNGEIPSVNIQEMKELITL